jgi:hypothetical protein
MALNPRKCKVQEAFLWAFGQDCKKCIKSQKMQNEGSEVNCRYVFDMQYIMITLCEPHHYVHIVGIHLIKGLIIFCVNIFSVV